MTFRQRTAARKGLMRYVSNSQKQICAFDFFLQVFILSVTSACGASGAGSNRGISEPAAAVSESEPEGNAGDTPVLPAVPEGREEDQDDTALEVQSETEEKVEKVLPDTEREELPDPVQEPEVSADDGKMTSEYETMPRGEQLCALAKYTIRRTVHRHMRRGMQKWTLQVVTGLQSACMTIWGII